MVVYEQNEFKGSSEPPDVDFKAAILYSTLALGNPRNIRIYIIYSVSIEALKKRGQTKMLAHDFK